VAYLLRFLHFQGIGKVKLEPLTLLEPIPHILQNHRDLERNYIEYCFDGIYINLNGNFPLRSESEIGFDPNLWVGFTHKNLNPAFEWYNGADFSLDIAYLILKGDKKRLGLALV